MIKIFGKVCCYCSVAIIIVCNCQCDLSLGVTFVLYIKNHNGNKLFKLYCAILDK